MVNNTKKGEINHMKAWEMAQEIFHNAQPVIRREEEQTWTDKGKVLGFYEGKLYFVPGGKGN